MYYVISSTFYHELTFPEDRQPGLRNFYPDSFIRTVENEDAVRSAIIEAAGYFLNSNSEFQALLNRIELADINSSPPVSGRSSGDGGKSNERKKNRMMNDEGRMLKNK